jgi:hypothetical protein
MIHVLRKPLSEGTVAANVLKHGTGGINIDAVRVAHGSDVNLDAVQRQQSAGGGSVGNHFGAGSLVGTVIPTYSPAGRWPANAILSHLAECRCDGIKRVQAITGGMKPGSTGAFGKHGVYGTAKGLQRKVEYGDADGKETVANWICEPDCPVARLDEQSGITTNTSHYSYKRSGGGFIDNIPDQTVNRHWRTETGGASRFYKQIGGSDE